jgi:hypothetical protein
MMRVVRGDICTNSALFQVFNMLDSPDANAFVE